MRRIRKISGARGAGLLDGWSMPAETNDFARINVVYGGNGSGKSTLARVFAEMCEPDSTDVNVQLEESGPDGTTRRVIDRADSFWSRVRVFNADYVSRNLLFDVEGRSDALPLLVLGEPNVDRDKRLSEIDPRLEAIPGELSEAQTASSDATKAANKLATDTARTIGQELQAAGGRYEARKYDARRLKEAFPALPDLECVASVRRRGRQRGCRRALGEDGGAQTARSSTQGPPWNLPALAALLLM